MKTISYINIYTIMTFLIDIFFGDYIVYMLKGKKGHEISAKVIELDCVFRAQREIDVSILEYGSRLFALPYDPNDKIGDIKTLYLNGDYVVRKRIGLRRDDVNITLVLMVGLFICLRYVIKQWNGFQDIIICILMCCALGIDIYIYPLVYKNMLKKIKKSLGWHIN